MAIPPVSFLRITEHKRNDLLDKGFDPPSESELSEAFSQKIRQVCARLQDRFSLLWQHGFEKDDEFFIHASSEDDRMLCVEIANIKIVDLKLLEIAHSAVADLAAGFCVDFCNSWDFLMLDSERLHPDFNIFVTKPSISIYSESDALLHTLGIADRINMETK